MVHNMPYQVLQLQYSQMSMKSSYIPFGLLSYQYMNLERSALFDIIRLLNASEFHVELVFCGID